jgi:hypothetical protein
MNKPLLIIFFVVFALGLIFLGAIGGSFSPAKVWKKDCTRIQDGLLYASDGSLIVPGYDDWGYNYEAHMFNGYYCDSYRDAEWCQPWKDVKLSMKWNDAWLSNMDCNDDELLDRHYEHDSYIGSGAWLTNHQSGTYIQNRKNCRWEYFVKIVAAPEDANLVNGVWYSADGDEIGPVIWGAFATIQQVYNDPCEGVHGLEYKAARPGLGNW